MHPALVDLLSTYADSLVESPGKEAVISTMDPDDANIVWLYEIFADGSVENAGRKDSHAGWLLRTVPLRLTQQESIFSED